MTELINDILKYLSNFIYRYDYTLLNKYYRDYYFKENGITLSAFYGQIINPEDKEKYKILLEYNLYLKLGGKCHNYIINIIHKLDAKRMIKKLQLPYELDRYWKIYYDLFPNVDWVKSYCSVSSILNPDYFPKCPRKKITLYIEDNKSIKDWDEIKKLGCRIHVLYLDGIPENFLESINILHNNITLTGNPIKLDNLVKLGYWSRRNMIAPKLKTVEKCLPDYLLEILNYPTISKIPKFIPLFDDASGELLRKEYRELRRFDFTGVFNSATHIGNRNLIDELIALENEIRNTTETTKKRRIRMDWYSYNDIVSMQKLFEAFDLSYPVSYDRLEELLEDIACLKNPEVPRLITISTTWKSPRVIEFTDLSDKILNLFHDKNILVFPESFGKKKPTSEVYKIKMLKEKYFGKYH